MGKRGSVHNLKHTSSLIKYDGGSVLAWACMAAFETGSLIFIDDVKHDNISKINSEVCVRIHFVHKKDNINNNKQQKTTVGAWYGYY